MENNENQYVVGNEGVKKEPTDVVGIIAIVLGGLAFLTGFMLVMPFIFGIPSIILGIISVIKSSKKLLGILSIVLSSIGMISVIVFVAVLWNIDFEEPVKTQADIEAIENTKVVFDNITVGNEQEEFLTGYSWVMGDYSELQLDDDGSFKWWQQENDYESNHYAGQYKVIRGELAVDILDALVGFDREGFEKHSGAIIDDVHILVLFNEQWIIDGENVMIPGETSETALYIYFEDEQSDVAVGANVQTFNNVHLTKVNRD